MWRDYTDQRSPLPRDRDMYCTIQLLAIDQRLRQGSCILCLIKRELMRELARISDANFRRELTGDSVL
jgi:hypothetical protein